MQTLPGTHFSALAIEGRIYEYDLSAFNLYVARPPHRWSAVHDKPNPLLAAAVAFSPHHAKVATSISLRVVILSPTRPHH
jgi:hypothetical protein